MKLFLVFAVSFFILALESFAGILPTSRGGTGANIVPVANSIVTSTSSGFALVNRITVGPGTTVAGGAPLMVTVGSSLATPVSGAIESNGTHLWWTDSGGARHRLDNTNEAP